MVVVLSQIWYLYIWRWVGTVKSGNVGGSATFYGFLLCLCICANKFLSARVWAGWEGRSCGPLLVPWILQHIFSTNWPSPPLLYLHSIRLSGMLLFSGRRNKCSLVAVHKLRATFVCLPLEMGIIIILLLLCYKSFCGTSSLGLRAMKIYSFSSWSLSSENYQFWRYLCACLIACLLAYHTYFITDSEICKTDLTWVILVI